MSRQIILLGLLIFLSMGFVPEDPILLTTNRIIDTVTRTGDSFQNLSELVSIGSRLSGSSNAEKAVDWAVKKLRSYGFDDVRTQPVQVPKWERGEKETATVFTNDDQKIPLRVAALGGSVGTGPESVSGEVVEVHSIDEVAGLADQVRGKIVFFNGAMRTLPDEFDAYSAAVDQRIDGASTAARYGAIAVFVRSLTTMFDDEPHTGIVHYSSDAPKIPAVAVSTKDAERLSSLLRADPRLMIKLELSAQSLGTVLSYNVIADLRGREKPEEIVLVGAHLDSWDYGVGAQDDGAGVAQSFEVLRALSKLDARPKRTVRVVLFMAEEFGGVGAREYAKRAREAGEKHIAAIESDRGAFRPVGFQLEGAGGALKTLQAWSGYLEPIHASKITSGFSGTDVEPLNALCPTLGYVPESSRYFDYHHSRHDQLSAIAPDDLRDGAAAMAVLTYLLAEKGL